MKVAEVQALEPIRRMRGGSQSQLIRCSDNNCYVVKFQNNPQGIRVLANELLGALLAHELGLPISQPAVVEVSPDLIHCTDHMTIELSTSRVPCQAGLCFGSRYPCDETSSTPASLHKVYDFLPQPQTQCLVNLSDFAGMLVFDKWTENTDCRQVVYVSETSDCPYRRYRALMIDQGFCFGGGTWGFCDNPRHGLHPERRVYETVGGLDAFEPWLTRLESEIDRTLLESAVREIPPEWYRGDTESVKHLIAALERRRAHVKDMLVSTRKCVEHFFPGWSFQSKAASSNRTSEQSVSRMAAACHGEATWFPH